MRGFDLVPATLPMVQQLSRLPDGRRWLAELPSLVEQVRAAFGLRLAPPLHAGSCSWVAPAELPDGTRAIVKIGWPHRGMYGEPVALRSWNGRGAVHLLAHDPSRHALLLERCEPGLPLADSTAEPEDRLRAGCAVLRLLWQARPAEELERLGSVTAEWADVAEERMARIRPGYDPGLVAEGVGLLRQLPGSADRAVLLHGDFNPGNILSAYDGGWVAIDPKPMIGDPGYDPWPLLEQVDDPLAHPDPAAVLRRRVQVLADELSLAAERIVLWSVARRVEAALWLAHHDNVPGGAAIMGEARVLADV
ncbi:streptomycin 6-kinase [Asanoa ferruginea]|uniref:Streptomycin 6-kinase n=1 Tax=Asanoa ferruginea TaxID=53367 RepID=A0A3D9ZEJ6_9ACTN|nr:aminoglycoside phosphotransferase family protein [Asanoa ferruginea]REF95836.1 streptomycin 6-kinase [Asanoa ferruginea]GIF53845.1 hydroxyurea phosphotransferase [Asanoa ferruginea]